MLNKFCAKRFMYIFGSFKSHYSSESICCVHPHSTGKAKFRKVKPLSQGCLANGWSQDQHLVCLTPKAIVLATELPSLLKVMFEFSKRDGKERDGCSIFQKEEPEYLFISLALHWEILGVVSARKRGSWSNNMITAEQLLGALVGKCLWIQTIPWYSSGSTT